MGEEEQTTLPANRGSIRQRHGRCLRQVRRCRIQQLRDQASRLQGAQYRNVDIPGSFGPQPTYRVHEAEEMSIESVLTVWNERAGLFSEDTVTKRRKMIVGRRKLQGA